MINISLKKTVTKFIFKNKMRLEGNNNGKAVNGMRGPRRRRKKCGTGAVLAIAAFLGAVMCLSFFSFKVMLFVIAVLLIVLGIFLLKL